MNEMMTSTSYSPCSIEARAAEVKVVLALPLTNYTIYTQILCIPKAQYTDIKVALKGGTNH